MSEADAHHAPLLALQQAQSFSGNSLSTVVALMTIGIVSLLGLLRREQRTRFPLLPVALLGQPAIWRSDALRPDCCFWARIARWT